MQVRAFLTALAGGFVAATGAFIACSSNGPAVQNNEAGAEAGSLDVVTVFETASADTYIAPPPADAGSDVSHPHDAMPDRGQPTDAPAPEEAHATGEGGAVCTTITGPCNLVSQNCSSGSECTLASAPDGSITTACSPTTAGEMLPLGTPCCPAANTNPCAPGLTCNGGNACGVVAYDAGKDFPAAWGGSRCAPTCCPGDGGPIQSNCGTTPGDSGIAGLCNLGLSFTGGGAPQLTVCTYSTPCEPLTGPHCIPDFGCEVVGVEAGASCQVVYNPDKDGGAGATEGQACVYANQCADGLVCLGATTSTCLWMCHIAGQATPFDAGILQATPGRGGCPMGETCGGVEGFPGWLGACSH
jgi:hypothetical protein